MTSKDPPFHILGVIPARGGSVRVPRKNIKPLGGKPLIAYTIEAAKKSKELDYFLVSTNDEEMAKISKSLGAPVPFKRPEKISTDCDTTLVLMHAVQKYEAKKNVKVTHIVCLQATSPFRTAEDIDECVKIAKATNVDSVVSFSKVAQHPYWMFAQKPYGHEMMPFLSDVKLQGDNLVSQNLPVLFYPNGAVYVTRRDVLEQKGIYGNRIYGYTMPEERSIDLETERDFAYASAMLPIIQSGKPFDKMSWFIS